MEIFKLAQSYKIDWGLVLDGKVYEVLSAHAQSLGCELDLLCCRYLFLQLISWDQKQKYRLPKAGLSDQV